ncbi:MAG: alpha/beta hydrolase family protein [Roseiflexaceae bacterium]
MRHRWLAAVLLVALALGLTPAAAEVVEIDPDKDPVQTLDQAESQRLAMLQHTAFPVLASEISPDDTTILHAVIEPGGEDVDVGFLNIADGSTTPAGNLVRRLPPFSELRWRDGRTLVYLSIELGRGPVLVAVDRVSGRAQTQPIRFKGFPVSMAPNGSRLLVALSKDPEAENQGDQASGMVSPFQLTVKRPFDSGYGLGRFDAERQTLQVAEKEVEFSVIDLDTGESTVLLSLPDGSGLISPPAWVGDGSKLALVHTTIPKVSRRGTELAEKTTQDALGNLAPADNPFLQNNAISVFDFPNHDLRPSALKAKDGNGDTFNRASWNSDGQTLLTQMWHPAKPAGRSNPTYLFPDRSYLRFYNAALQQIGTFDSPQTEAPELAVPQFVSPDEVIITTPYGLSYRIYYYNRVSGEFRQASIWDGTYLQVRASHLSRQLVFNFSSFDHALDLYRISWEGTALSRLTWYNGEAESQNHIRADQVTFTMQGGARRAGYLIQPADAPFPPRNVPVVVWQEGGPGGAMTNQWGGIVERPLNLLPNFGIAVLLLPLPGREGYGPKFYNALADGRNFGAIDIDEGAQAVQQMIQRGWTSRGKVGITGCSYGGYYTVQSIIRHPDLYAAANTQCTLLDLFTEWELGYTPQVSYLEGRPPTTDSAEYLRDSPIYNAAKIRTPLLIFAGTFDFLPVTISGNLHDQVATSKTAVKFLKFQGEGHGLGAPNDQTTAAQAQITWFREHLTGKSKLAFSTLTHAQ